MKPHYFDDEKVDRDDALLQLCVQQGYVPPTCLLGGIVVWVEVKDGRDACAGCHGPREKCHGRPYAERIN